MGQHNEIRFNVILKYCVVEKFLMVLCTTPRNCQRGPTLIKYEIFGLILIILILPILILIYINIDFFGILRVAVLDSYIWTIR